MKKVLVFGASNSSKSINKKLATYASTLLENSESTIIDLNNFEMPIYSMDREAASGIPKRALEFKSLIRSHDGLIISLAEHNGSYSTAFKNIFDWVSRIKGSCWEEKTMLLMATSPGGRGGASVLETASTRFPFNGGKVVESFSLPSFGNNFDSENGVTHAEKREELKTKVKTFEEKLINEEEH